MSKDNKNTENKITMDKTFQLSFYDYATPFYGSFRGMRYRLARTPLEKVYGKSQEVKEAGKLEAIVWPGPMAFDYTKEEDKIKKEFPYTKEGKEEAIQWLNEQYEERKEQYTEVYHYIR